MSDARPAVATLQWIHDRWPDLWEARLRGTTRPWRQPGSEIPAVVKAQREWDARIERIEADRHGRTPGYSRAPLHVDILDTLADILMTADLLHEQVAQTIGHPTLAHPSSAYADPRPYLAYTIELLPEACETDPGMLEGAAETANTMQAKTLTALGEIIDGHTLDAICPFCLGVTSHHPAGGAKTLRFRILDAPTDADPKAVDPVIMCENPTACTPFAAECSKWIKGQPAWRWPEWDWLGKRLLPTDLARATCKVIHSQAS